MTLLPSWVPQGTVTGQFDFVSTDGTDTDANPELFAVTGTVDFTCSASPLPLKLSVPSHNYIGVVPLSFSATFDSEGYLGVLQGDGTNFVRGIELPATDSALFNPSGFTWHVEFNLRASATGYTVNLPAFDISVPTGGTVDLITVMPVSSANGVPVILGPAGPIGPQGPQGDVSTWKPNTVYSAGQPVVNPSGDVVTRISAGSDGASYVPANWALSPSYAPVNLPALLSGGRSWGFLGDSITNRSTAAAGRGYIDYIPWLVGTQHVASTGPNTALPGVAVSVNAGVPGERTDQMLLRVDALIAKGISGMTLLGGTNDASQGVSTATFLSNVDAIAKKCRKAGIPLVVGTVPPRGASASTAIHTSIIGYNLALRQWAPKNGVYLASTHGALVDISSGAMLSAYDSGDATHPNTAGHLKLAQAFTAAVSQAIIRQTPIVSAKSAVSLISNPLFQTNSTGWYEQPGGTGTAPVYSRVADITGRLPIGASWYEMDFDATVSGGTRMLAFAPPSTGWTVGDNLLVAASIDLVDVSGYAAAANADPNTANFKIGIYDQSGAGLPNAQSGVPPLGQTPGELAFVFQVPSGVTGIFLYIPVTLPTGVHLKFRISAIDIRNLTALGVTNY